MTERYKYGTIRNGDLFEMQNQPKHKFIQNENDIKWASLLNSGPASSNAMFVSTPNVLLLKIRSTFSKAITRDTSPFCNIKSATRLISSNGHF